jgi:hypothetical protein
MLRIDSTLAKKPISLSLEVGEDVRMTIDFGSLSNCTEIDRPMPNCQLLDAL